VDDLVSVKTFGFPSYGSNMSELVSVVYLLAAYQTRSWYDCAILTDRVCSKHSGMPKTESGGESQWFKDAI
jgi:hypothetical protein